MYDIDISEAGFRLMAAPIFQEALETIANTACDHGPGFCPRDVARAALQHVAGEIDHA